ncbi:hypothetical protein ACFOSC_09460 [Streptantibioticus rubrisoli]|uniref:Uncharacterized protein n=1 Tax=Streptantibioticus rubrisoli TaxID=1387313 RepID=A0ABT1P6G5_9ACTN|nr:hypothetical protein [Streptantibioticus rubrisoli]MCQ4040937.1 hypothetical protein [Streptantibioticus rubrisoli]
MYEMRAEFDPDATGGLENTSSSLALLWHVISKEDSRMALCGQQLVETVHDRLVAAGHAATERCCSPCLAVVRATMQAEDARVGADQAAV